MEKITAVILTFNEEKNIDRCLRSLQKVADEIIVVDSYSTDRTKEICEAYPSVRFLQQAWLGFGPQKNWGNDQASYDYILSLDADEALSEELAAAILRVKQESLKGCYSLDRLNYYYGKFLKHGLEYPDRKPRLFNRTTARWNTSPVHEELDGASHPVLLNGYLHHYTYHSVTGHLEKTDRYSTLAAKGYLDRGKKPAGLKLVFSPLFTFINAYILRAGFLDGKHGLVVACMRSFGAFLKYAKHWQLYYFSGRI